MQFKKLRLVGLALIVAASGCLGGSTEPIDATGIYVLTSINGQALPFTYAEGGTVKSEVLQLNGDATYSDTITRPDNSVIIDVGNYNNFAGSLSFADITLGLLYNGTLSGNTLTVKIGNYTEIFAKTKL